MDETFSTAFRLMGARVRVGAMEAAQRQQLEFELREWRGKQIDASVARALLDSLRVDVRRDERGEYFDVRCDDRIEVDVADVRAEDRHLLLTARVPVTAASRDEQAVSPQSVFLCGHDEKAWFVAAIPESAEARDVQEAKDALKPRAVWDAMHEAGVPLERRDARKTAAFVRQGEWFFIPRPGLKVDARRVRRHEAIQRGAAREHLCQFLYQVGGEPVYVNDAYENGISQKEFDALPLRERWYGGWERRARDAHVYVKGNIRHPDHKTVFLSDWHEVVPNTETQSQAMRQVAFLD